MATLIRASSLPAALLLLSSVLVEGQPVQYQHRSTVTTAAAATAAGSATATGGGQEPPEGETHLPAPIPEHKHLSAPNCPSWTFVDSPLGAPAEHSDDACDRSYENDPDRIESLRDELRRSVVTGELRRLRDERTWVCPADDVAASTTTTSDGGGEGNDIPLGPRSVWLFRNEASTPVSVGWINSYRNDLEVSAFDPDVSPPHADPDAIVRPGEWRALDVFLGHTFQIRELRSGPSGGGGAGDSGFIPGRVLLRHRPGPIPVRNRLGGPRACPVNALVDPDPQTESPNRRAKDEEAELERIEEGRRKFRRTDFHYNHRCNALHRVFANRVGCPVDVYYAGVDSKGHVASREGVDARSVAPSKGNSTDASPNQSNACFERFKFHLGINPSDGTSSLSSGGGFGNDNYADRWDSPVAFEATYLTHKFVARLRHDPSIVVDEIVVDRTVVRDCPEEGTRNDDKGAVKEGVKAEVRRAEADVDADGEVVTATVVGEKFDALGEAALAVAGGLGRNFTKAATTVVLSVNAGNATADDTNGSRGKKEQKRTVVASEDS